VKLFLVEFLLKLFSFFDLEKKTEKKNRDEREVRFRNNTVSRDTSPRLEFALTGNGMGDLECINDAIIPFFAEGGLCESESDMIRYLGE
jgi:hypothetical protein